MLMIYVGMTITGVGGGATVLCTTAMVNTYCMSRVLITLVLTIGYWKLKW